MKFIMNTFHIMKFIFNFITGQCSFVLDMRAVLAFATLAAATP